MPTDSPTPTTPCHPVRVRRRRWRRVAVVAALTAAMAACASDEPPAWMAPAAGTDAAAGADGSTPTRPDDATPLPGPDGSAGRDDVGDPYFAGLGNGAYDVDRYVLDLEWIDETGILEGRTTIQARATQALSSFTVDYSGDDVTSVVVDGVDAEFTRDGIELLVEPATPIGDGAPFSVAIDHGGRPGRIPSLTNVDLGGWFVEGATAFALSEPAGSHAWHPVNDHPIDKAAYRIEVTADADLVVASGGSLVSSTRTGDRITWVFEMPDPQAPYLTPLAIGDLVRIDRPDAVGGVEIRHYLAASRADLVDRFAAIPSMIEVFSELFGPYPFDQFGVLVVDTELGLALEQQTLAIFGDDWLDGPQSELDSVVAHELAHQWFGDAVTVEQWDDIWLNEGFATYAEFLYREAVVDGFDIDAELDGLVSAAGDLLESPAAGDPGGDELFAASVYYRGALTLHALRREVGDDAFFAILQAHVTRHTGGNVSTEDFIELAEERSGRDLGALFDAWLAEGPLPR